MEMEITKSNFESLLPFIKSTLLGSDFISIDCEFTGLHTPGTQFDVGDSPGLRYSKLSKCVQQFSVIQYGVCGFKNISDKFIASPFNFYVYASGSNVVQVERILTFEAGSVKFLRTNQFDFNKLIDDGIPYFSFSEENGMLPSKSKFKTAEWRPINEILLPRKTRRYLYNMRKVIQRWLLSDEQSYVLQANGSEQQRLICQEIQDPCYEDKIQASVRDSKHLSLLKTSIVQSQQRVLKDHENFRTVIEIIQEAECPVIAHNAAFDVLHTVHQFWQRLPAELKDFKEVANNMWKTFVDTRYLAENHPKLKRFCNFKDLATIYKEAVKQVGEHVVMADGFDRYESKFEHEAGYDAYMTGVAYIGLINYAEDQSTLSYYNKIYLSKCVNNCINLKKDKN